MKVCYFVLGELRPPDPPVDWLRPPKQQLIHVDGSVYMLIDTGYVRREVMFIDG